MNKIIEVEEIKIYKDIGKNPDKDKISQLIEEAQITHLKDTLGSQFYFDLYNNLDNPIYQDLLSGSSFSYKDINYYQDGIKALLSDYFMSKYVMQINVNFTPFGATVKETDNSSPVERNTLKDISTQQLQLASSRWELIEMYLDSNKSIFSNWKNNTCTNSSENSERRYKFRIIK